MKVTGKKVIMILMQFVIIICMDLLMTNNSIGSYGFSILLYSVFSILCLSVLQKKIVTPINILFVTFILFQAGIPIAYSIDGSYSNFYMSLFSSKVINEAGKYTLWSIQAFSFALLLCIDGNAAKKKKIIFSRNPAVNNIEHVYNLSKIVFVLTSMVVVPLYTFVAYLSIVAGFSQQVRSIVASNALFNLSRAFYIPSFFLLVCYGTEKSLYAFLREYFI